MTATATATATASYKIAKGLRFRVASGNAKGAKETLNTEIEVNLPNSLSASPSATLHAAIVELLRDRMASCWELYSQPVADTLVFLGANADERSAAAKEAYAPELVLSQGWVMSDFDSFELWARKADALGGKTGYAKRYAALETFATMEREAIDADALAGNIDMKRKLRTGLLRALAFANQGTAPIGAGLLANLLVLPHWGQPAAAAAKFREVLVAVCPDEGRSLWLDLAAMLDIHTTTESRGRGDDAVTVTLYLCGTFATVLRAAVEQAWPANGGDAQSDDPATDFVL